MANKIYPFLVPSNFTYDNTKVIVENGVAKLKLVTDVAGLVGYWRFENNCLDSSGQVNHGTNHGATFVNGKLGKCLSFDGSNYVDCGDVEQEPSHYTIELWAKRNTITGYKVPISLSVNYAVMLWVYEAGRIAFGNANGGWCNWDTVWTDKSNFHHIVIVVTGSNVKLLFDNVDWGSKVSSTAGSWNNVKIGGNMAHFNGLIDEVAIWSRALTIEEVLDHYNSGVGKCLSKYPTDKPIIKPTTSWEVTSLTQFTAFAETLGGGNQGNIVYQLSDDNGATWKYWNGSTWATTTAEYNDDVTVHAQIGSFPVNNGKILFKAFLISDGEQQCELDALEFTALVGIAPVVYSGSDKSCHDHEAKKPFSDATIADLDGDIENATAYRKIESGNWTQVEKGLFGTLQEAIRDYSHTFDNLGQITCYLKITDESGKSAEDDMIMTVQKYTVTFNIRDTDGNHLANFLFLSGDGSDWQQKNSPFTWDYAWQANVYKVVLDKAGFQTTKVDVVASTHTENITLNVLGAASPADVADAVWNELRDTHTIGGSFGESLQAKLSDVKSETDKIQIIDNNVDTIKTGVTNLDILIKRILGLNKENYKLYDTVYDGNRQLVTGKIKIYPTATDLDNNTNTLGNYQIDAEYNTNATCKTFKVKKI